MSKNTLPILAWSALLMSAFVFSSSALSEAVEHAKKSANSVEAVEITPAERIKQAIVVFEAQMDAPVEQRISAQLLENARCIAMIPGMLQGGAGIGLKHGSGVMSCRHYDTGSWGVPAFIRLSGASMGLQLGIQKMDVVILVMTHNGLNQLLSGIPVVSGDAGVSLGPVGRNAEIALDDPLQTPMFSYTRASGFYAGATLGGSMLTTAKKVNLEVYGEYADAYELLLIKNDIPVVVKPLVDALQKYAPGSK